MKDKNSRYYVPLTKKLASIIRKNEKINVTPQKIASWTKAIKNLVETDGVSIQRIQAALDWCEENIDGPYVPVIRKASTYVTNSSTLSVRCVGLKLLPVSRRRILQILPKTLRKYYSNSSVAKTLPMYSTWIVTNQLKHCLKEPLTRERCGNAPTSILSNQRDTRTTPERRFPGQTPSQSDGTDCAGHRLDSGQQLDYSIRSDVFDLNHSLFNRIRRIIDEAKTDRSGTRTRLPENLI